MPSGNVGVSSLGTVTVKGRVFLGSTSWTMVHNGAIFVCRSNEQILIGYIDVDDR